MVIDFRSFSGEKGAISMVSLTAENFFPTIIDERLHRRSGKIEIISVIRDGTPNWYTKLFSTIFLSFILNSFTWLDCEKWHRSKNNQYISIDDAIRLRSQGVRVHATVSTKRIFLYLWCETKSNTLSLIRIGDLCIIPFSSSRVLTLQIRHLFSFYFFAIFLNERK